MGTAADRIEGVVDVAAAALLSAATAFSVLRIDGVPAVAGASAASGFCLALALLRSIRPRPQFAFSTFAPGELDDFDVVVPRAAKTPPEPLLLTHSPQSSLAQTNVPHELLLTALDRLQAVPAFDLPELVLCEADRIAPIEEADELLLGASDELAPAALQPESELLLDDILARLGPDSRVVRLFDPAAMPTIGELKSRIDRHLDSSRQSPPPVDASAALHEALDELRRAIR